jgi:anti-sigma regulatory factor (Ser/Thr protein kinase)
MSGPTLSLALDVERSSFRADPEGISAVDTWVEEIGHRWCVDEKVSFRARLCIAEIAANVLEHGAVPESAEFTVTLRRRGMDLDVEFADSGQPFDPTAVADILPPQSVESARIGGLGLHLVRSFASDLTYRRDGPHNHLTFRLSPGRA